MHDSYFRTEFDPVEFLVAVKKYTDYMTECSDETESLTEDEYENIIELIQKANDLIRDVEVKFDLYITKALFKYDVRDFDHSEESA